MKHVDKTKRNAGFAGTAASGRTKQRGPRPEGFGGRQEAGRSEPAVRVTGSSL